MKKKKKKNNNNNNNNKDNKDTELTVFVWSEDTDRYHFQQVSTKMLCNDYSIYNISINRPTLGP